MNTPPEKRDPADIEREASEIRADMDRTLDALERKFSPGQLLDRSLGYLRTHGGDLTRNIGDTVKQNPVPIFITAAGLTWLIASAVSSRYRSEPYYDLDADDDDMDDYEVAADEEPRSSLREKVQDRVAATRERLRSSRATAANKMSQAMDVTRERTAQVRGRVSSMMEEQPLVFGAIAVAVGALIGAALPTTEVENRTVGQVRDRTLEKARQAGQRQYETLRSKLAPEDTEVTRARTEH
jgi:ElaB/YqjD/DUF883 family membrane-anchored ribosome-binding protein